MGGQRKTTRATMRDRRSTYMRKSTFGRESQASAGVGLGGLADLEGLTAFTNEDEEEQEEDEEEESDEEDEDANGEEWVLQDLETGGEFLTLILPEKEKEGEEE